MYEQIQRHAKQTNNSRQLQDRKGTQAKTETQQTNKQVNNKETLTWTNIYRDTSTKQAIQ